MRARPATSLLALTLASLTLGACTHATTASGPAANAHLPQVPTQLPRTAKPLHYRIEATPDAQNLRFSGKTSVDIEVLQATDAITLNAADLQFGTVSLSGPGGLRSPANVATNETAQTATFTFTEPLAPGRYTLDMLYTGRINTQAAGLFALDYPSAGGTKRALYTQFEAPDARRFFPGWDEPIYRAPYDLTVTVPANQTAVSNMPVAKREDLPDGLARVTFETTPSMSSYLLFLGMGEFDRITTQAGGTEIGVVTKKGDGEKGREALAGSARIVPYYNDYFGVPYPLPKLDNVAGPGSSQFFSAMENWGAIFTFENTLLVDPAITTDADRQRIFEVAAHEIAHQWFGNLVTMAWWGDLWLNEGFASWMATKSTDALNPQWEVLLARVGGREGAMRLDSVATTHPVVQDINTVEQASQAFDAISYEKGEAVITMLEDYVGADAWRAGVRDYISTYKYGNTVSDNLWGKVEKAAGKPITAIAHDFTLQPGVPLIRVESATCEGGATQVRLSQGEFTRDRMDKQPLRWRVPVIAATLGGREARQLVEGGSAAFTVPGCGPLLVNSGQAGYYRTLYTPAMLDQLTARYGGLEPIDQLGLLADTWSLGLAGYQPASEALDLIAAVPDNANPRVWSSVGNILSQIYGMYEGDAARQAQVARYASARLSSVLNRLGWEPRPNERETEAVLRSSLISILGSVGDPAVVAEANRRYAAGPLSGPLRSAILGVVAANLDAKGWEALRAQAKGEQNKLVRSQLYRLLGSAKDEALARRALDLALSGEPDATDSSQIIAAVAAGHPDLAFDFAVRNREKVESLVDVSSRSRFIAQLGGGSADPAMIAKIEDFASRYLTPESRRPADQAIVSIRDRLKVLESRLPDISRWLAARAG
ncbi:ERAP1-like C-terminal domain-containing protein [Allosphingosinicella flava]|uniref:Aminopeptidase n=1 Tax=Allosphingosinicella flava TaxID=2771430 RepID=A0A7T2LM43_9SPHN|nr:M1 family metallopeptidase [Sphingosinicella flava]QPQ54998.1 ERAP1-like C-terminal domain-containing protein [Sphingosinicella flava]